MSLNLSEIVNSPSLIRSLIVVRARKIMSKRRSFLVTVNLPERNFADKILKTIYRQFAVILRNRVGSHLTDSPLDAERRVGCHQVISYEIEKDNYYTLIGQDRDQYHLFGQVR